MPAAQVQMLAEVQTQPDHVYCLPESEAEEATYCIRQPDELIHIKTDFGKAMDLHNAYAVLRSPQAGGHAWLTYVVPPDVSQQHKLQHITGPADWVRQKSRIRQRVLTMPLTPRAALAAFRPAQLFC